MTVNHRFSFYVFLMFTVLMCGGCYSHGQGNTGILQSYAVPDAEASWIRNGEPIIFEGEAWFPVDGMESFLDSEVLLMGEFRGVQYFVDKLDVRPYNRLYTKYARNKFRYFEPKAQ